MSSIKLAVMYSHSLMQNVMYREEELHDKYNA